MSINSSTNTYLLNKPYADITSINPETIDSLTGKRFRQLIDEAAEKKLGYIIAIIKTAKGPAVTVDGQSFVRNCVVLHASNSDKKDPTIQTLEAIQAIAFYLLDFGGRKGALDVTEKDSDAPSWSFIQEHPSVQAMVKNKDFLDLMTVYDARSHDALGPQQLKARAFSRTMLGTMYLQRSCSPKLTKEQSKRDQKLAFYWFMRAAEGTPRPLKKTCIALYACYAKGFGVEASKIEAQKWKDLCAKK